MLKHGDNYVKNKNKNKNKNKKNEKTTVVF